MDVLSILKGSIKPVPNVTVSEWADEFRKLSQKASSEFGQWRTDRTPYLKEIMDALTNDNGIEKVVFIKGAQVGGTEAGLNWIGYCIDVNPAPIMIVWPTLDDAKSNSKLRIDTLIEGTPSISEKIKPARSRDSGNTTLLKEFQGGSITIVGSNSPSKLRSKPIKYLFFDEVDAFPTDTGEGSPIELAIKRTSTYSDSRKILMVSTPTRKGESLIEKEFEKTNKMYYHVPCPECDYLQVLKLENLVWEKGKYDDVRYACEHCGNLIAERYKPYMLKHESEGGKAKFIATHNNNNPSVVGFHLASFYSPLGWLSWSQICREYDDADGLDEKLRVFYNTICGETYEEKSDAPEWEMLYNRRENYKINTVPNDVYFLTCGVDVQKNRLEYEIVGWCKGRKSYSIRYDVIVGDTSQQEVWDELATVLNETFEVNGTDVKVSKMFIDSGYNTSTVYAFVNKHKHTGRVEAIKGKDSWDYHITTPKRVNVLKAGDKAGTCSVRTIGVSALKAELYGWLKLHKLEDGSAPDCYCYFPEYNGEFFKGLCGETLMVKKNRRGYETKEWHKHYKNNEPLDCRVYARAAAISLGMDKYENRSDFWEKFKQKEKTVKKRTYSEF